MTAVMVSLATLERDKAVNSLDSFIMRYGTARDINSKTAVTVQAVRSRLTDRMVVDGEEEVKGPLLDVYSWTSQICSVTLPSAYALFVTSSLANDRRSARSTALPVTSSELI